MPTVKQRVIVKGNQPNDTIVEQIVNYNALRVPNITGRLTTPSLRPIARIGVITTPIRKSVEDCISLNPINIDPVIPTRQKAIDLFIHSQEVKQSVPLYLEVSNE